MKDEESREGKYEAQLGGKTRLTHVWRKES